VPQGITLQRSPRRLNLGSRAYCSASHPWASWGTSRPIAHALLPLAASESVSLAGDVRYHQHILADRVMLRWEMRLTIEACRNLDFGAGSI